MKEASSRPRNCCLALSVAGAVLFVVGLVVGRAGNCSVMEVHCFQVFLPAAFGCGVWKHMMYGVPTRAVQP